MTSVVNILNELAASLGHEAVRSACLQFAGKKAAAVEKPAKPVKEKKPRGPNGWTEFVTSVLEEMQAEAPEGTKVIRKEAMAVAGERWAAQKGPEALKAYHERQKAKAEKKAGAGGAAGDDASSVEEGEIVEPPAPAAKEKKPRGRPPKAKAATPQPEHSEQEQEAFRYLFDLQASGAANPLEGVNLLPRDLGIDRDTAFRIVQEYMSNYNELKNLYGSGSGEDA